MEMPRHRKSTSLTPKQENRLTQNYMVNRKPSDFHFYNEEIAKRDMHMLNTARGSSKFSTGETMKKLLADEMSKEMESKRRSPSVVARLMGLDGLPSSQNCHRQQKTWSSNHQQKSLSKVVQKDDDVFGGKSSKRSSLDRREFKDVYEDLEAYHVGTQRNMPKYISKLRKPEISILEQKLPIPKPCPRDEDLNDLAGFTENMSANSNNELLLKFLIRTGSLCLKHVNDLQCELSSSLHSHIAILKPLKSDAYESNAKAWNSGGECSCKYDGRFHRRRKDRLLLNPPIRRSSVKSPAIQSDEVRVKQKLPTQIVVLKPRKSSDTMPSVLSPGFSHSYVAHRMHQSAEYIGAAPRATCALSDFQGISRPICREAREVAKNITGQIKDTFASFDSRPISSKCSKERGYAGDESSNDFYDSDSDSIPDIMTLKPGNLFGRSNQLRVSAKSSVNREAKKRISERWKMANKYQSEKVIAKGNTLGEMLECEELKKGLGKFNVYKPIGLASNNKMSVWNRPSGISSNDGWKDGCTEKHSISKSIPHPLGSKSQKRSERHKEHTSDRHVQTQVDQCKTRVADGNISCIERFSPGVLKSNGEGALSCQDKYVVNVISTSETTCRLDESKENSELSEEQIKGSSDPESEIRRLPGLAASEIDISDTYVSDQEDVFLQEASIVISEADLALTHCPAPEPETSESFSDAEFHSPISVLESTSSASGSEGFRSVFDGLQELRKQLQLLKMDTTEVSTVVTNNDDFPPQIEDDHLSITENWEDMYIVDLLENSGLDKFHRHTFNEGWQSLQIPVGASVFNTLEKKYRDGIAERRSERKLLFDQINSVLLEIFVEDTDSCLWVEPAPRTFDSNWQKLGLRDELKTLLASKDKGTEGSTPMKKLDVEMEWPSNRGDISIIGKDIEKILTDELIMEIVSL